MTRSKTIIGALVLCALSICAFGAASAFAEEGHLTLVECKEVAKGTGKYNSHCPTPTVKEGNFETEKIETAEVEGTDTRSVTPTQHELGNTTNPVTVFHSTVNGIETTVTCGAGNTTGGTLKNKEERISGTGGAVTWTECHASPKTKPTKICTVQGVAPVTAVGTLKTNPVGTTSGLPRTTEAHKVVITPEVEEAAEKTFIKFKINASGGECFTAAALEVKVTGQAWGRANTETHSHLTLDETSDSGSPLRANGATASQTETVTTYTKGNKEATVGTQTFEPF